MIKAIFRQIGYGTIVLWGVVSLVFMLFIILPGDPAQMMVGQRSDEQTLKNIRKEYGLEQPVWKQYAMYINDLSPLAVMKTNATGYAPSPDRYKNHFSLFSFLDNWQFIVKWPYMRDSYQNKRPVDDMIAAALPNTLLLALISIALASSIGVFLGVIAALFKGSFFDKSIVSIAALGMSVPSFFAAILIGWLFAYVLSEYTGLNLTGSLLETDIATGETRVVIKNIILPALTLAIRPLSVFIQLVRNSLIQENSSEYFVTALAKGCSTKRAIMKHAMKNALNPVITAISGWFASMLAGVVFVEYIFGWKGIGELLVSALNNYDFPLVMGCILSIALLFLLITIFVDVVYKWLDPRIRYQNVN